MNQPSNPAIGYLHRFQRQILLPGLGCLAGVGLLGSSTQAAQIVIDGAGTPSPTTPLPDVSAVPIAPTPLLPTIEPAPIGGMVESSPAEGPLVEVIPTQRAVSPVSGNANAYDAPAKVILSERSSGCQTVLARGQAVSTDLCPPAPVASQRTASQSQGGGYGTGTLGNPRQVGVSQLGNPNSRSWQAFYKTSARPQGRPGNGNLKLLFPLPIPAVITSAFGWRIHPIYGTRRFHAGTDIGAPMGAPVLAAYAGRVAIADFLDGYGLTVTLDHKKGTQQTLYAHLSEIFVRPGEWVPQGTVIGRVGSTGNSTGPHLHFELRENTVEGWVAIDAGTQLEFALAQLVQSLQVAQAPKPAKEEG